MTTTTSRPAVATNLWPEIPTASNDPRDAKPQNCTLPWCVEDWYPGTAGSEDAYVLIHSGRKESVELRTRDRSHEYPQGTEHVGVARVFLSRLDDNHPASPTTGDTQVIVEMPNADGIDTADALRLAALIASQARLDDEAATNVPPSIAPATGEDAGERCYLPWCDDSCFSWPSNGADGDYGHDHFGAPAAVDVRGIHRDRQTTIKIELERSDRDGDDGYGPTSGETLVYMNVALDGLYTDGQAMTPDEAERVAWNLISRAHTARTYADLSNPNRVTAADIAQAVASNTVVGESGRPKTESS